MKNKSYLNTVSNLIKTIWSFLLNILTMMKLFNPFLKTKQSISVKQKNIENQF
jgi:hypothetical protein